MPPPSKRRGLPTAVIDNTLLSRLVRLEVAEFLPLLFKQVRIPPEVKREAYKAPHKGKRRLRKLIKEMTGYFVDCLEADEGVKLILKADLDDGEAAAIAQADFTESVLLLDERKGYERAEKMEVRTIRTANLLIMMKEAGAIKEVKPYLQKLVNEMGFYLRADVFQQLLDQAGECS
jgi:predicted nucleic acid-binding protein